MASALRRTALAMVPGAAEVRCAIYTRKSTEEGLQQEFNSLDAQREAAEAYIHSQRQEGWTALADRYDDGGFTGATVERPALQRLLANIRAGQIDCVIVYKVDRLSRSLLDFARLMEVFDRHRVSFVSVTQQFNTTASLGRLTLNILLSFAQFERELIAERTRDKMRAARRRGKWTGGVPVLGYDLDRAASKLVVNAEEARQVQAIFELYQKHRSVETVLENIKERGWRTKQWSSCEGSEHGGIAFTCTSLMRLLRNVVYTGRIRQERTLHEGEHDAIVEAAVWDQVNACLNQRGPVRARQCRGKALLAGLLHCDVCDCLMSATSTMHHGKRYRYYACPRKCAGKLMHAERMESSVVEQILGLGSNAARAKEMARQLCREPRATESQVSERDVAEALLRLPAAWPQWDALQKLHLIRRLVERMTYRPAGGRVTLKLQATAAAALQQQLGADDVKAKPNEAGREPGNRSRTTVQTADGSEPRT